LIIVANESRSSWGRPKHACTLSRGTDRMAGDARNEDEGGAFILIGVL
jgi:hypothetical protein